MEALLLEGQASGGGIPLTREFWKEIKVEARAIVTKHKTQKQP